jgi:hypothetical protein
LTGLFLFSERKVEMWNYRVIKDEDYDEEYPLSIREVYYNEDGYPFMTEIEPCRFSEESIEDLKDTLRWMCKALDKPIIDIKDIELNAQEIERKKNENIQN